MLFTGLCECFRSADLSIASRPSLRADLIMKNNNESIRAWAKRCHLTIHSSLVTFAPAARLKEFQPSGPPARSRVVTEYYSYDNEQLITKRKCGLSAIAPKFCRSPGAAAQCDTDKNWLTFMRLKLLVIQTDLLSRFTIPIRNHILSHFFYIY